jgi:uncharacterized RDD family membrane protein YckC
MAEKKAAGSKASSENKSDDKPIHLDLPGERSVKVNANILKRMLAFLLDMIILSFLAFPLQAFMKIEQKETFSETLKAMVASPEVGSRIALVAFFFAILAILYFTILEYMTRQSVGKIMFGLHVDAIDRKLGFWQALGRNLFLLPFIPFSILAIVDPFVMLFTKDNQRLSEILTKTKVVEYVKV